MRERRHGFIVKRINWNGANDNKKKYRTGNKNCDNGMNNYSYFNLKENSNRKRSNRTNRNRE